MQMHLFIKISELNVGLKRIEAPEVYLYLEIPEANFKYELWNVVDVRKRIRRTGKDEVVFFVGGFNKAKHV